MISYSAKSSSSSFETQNRRKRCRICTQSSLQQLVSDDEMEKLGLDNETLLTRMNTSIQGLKNKGPSNEAKNYGRPLARMNTSIQGLKYKGPPNEAKNFDHQLRRKRVSGIQRNSSNARSVASLMNNLASECMLPHLTGNDVGNERRDEHKFGDISKEIDDVITRIKCLIPSLQRLVNSGQAKDKALPAGDDIGQVLNFRMHAEGMLSKQVNQMLRKSNDSAPLSVNQSHNVYCVLDDLLKQTALLQKEVNPKMDDIEHLSKTMSQTMIVQPLSLLAQRSQVPELKAKASRAGSLKWASIRTESVASQTPEHIQGLRIMPCQFFKERPNQSQNNSREGTLKEAVIRSQMAASPSVVSANFMRPNRMNNLGGSDYKWINGHTGARIRVKKGLPSQSLRKKNNGILQSIVQGHHGSQESSLESLSSSSRVSRESGSCPTSSWTYETTNRSDESEEQHGEGESSPGYDTSSFDSSEYLYSDMSHSSQSSEARPYKRVQHVERGNGAGRCRRFKNKIGKIFHHHHHHHHHHHYRDNDEVGYMRSFWKRVGSMFQHTRKSDQEKPKVDNPRKSLIKSVPGKKQQGGHFHALLGGLMRHLKHSKKAKQPIAGIGKSARKQQLPWLPKKLKRVGTKMPNKGRIKLATRTKRPPLAVAKRFLRQ